MRVGFDGTLFGPRTSGAGEYQRQLVRHLPEVAPDVQLTVYTARGSTLDAGGTDVHAMPWAAHERVRRIVQGAFRWRARWRADRLDLLHVPFYYLPPGAPHKSIVTIYDTRFLRFPRTYPAARAAFLRATVPSSLRRARLVLTISEFSKAELVELVGLDPERIRVTLLAPRAEFRQPVDDAQRTAVRAKYRLPKSYILSTSTLEPRKNLARTVEAFARLRREGFPHELVLAGVRYFGADDIARTIARLGLTNVVRVLGYVDDADMPALYAQADVFVYPSLYEGFGLPPLEAMACGTPVVAAAASSVPEVVGDAARLVDPLSASAIADGLRAVLGDPDEASRLVTRGHARVPLFSWDRTAAATAEAYRHVHAQEA